MTTFRVYYMRPAWFRNGIMGSRPDPKNLDATHIFLRHVDAGHIEDVFGMMQAEFWSPNGEARDFIRERGLQHTSMSVGDVAVEANGRVWLCASVGFIDLTDGNAEGFGETGA
jgi:hypothetical protein